jgi:hypothetical protein
MKNSHKSETWDDQLEQLRIEFNAGNRSAFLDALLLAIQCTSPRPAWLADAALETKNGLNSGRYRDTNDAFGWTNGGKKKRGVPQRRAKHKAEILAALVRYRLDGGSLNRQIYSHTIASELSVNFRDVESVYRSYREFIKALPRKRKNKSDTYSFADITLPSASVSATG